jgi:O-6-methylguanine DNA methyltransferase
LCGASFDGLHALRERWPRARFERDDVALRSSAEALRQRLRGQHLMRPLSIVLAGTGLQLAVWRALLALPDGSVTTYSALAGRVGARKAVRAVASAVGANPVACLIPCHRVIRASGELGLYRWGSARKAALLAREWVRAG